MLASWGLQVNARTFNPAGRRLIHSSEETHYKASSCIVEEKIHTCDTSDQQLKIVVTQR